MAAKQQQQQQFPQPQQQTSLTSTTSPGVAAVGGAATSSSSLLDDQESIIKQLNEAELVLSTALYQSKQKLNLIKKAHKRPINSEDLIRYAHNISSQHSVASPYDWNIGDQRRPYPTDLQMRQSLLNGNAPSASDASPFHFIPTGLPGSDANKKVNLDEKDVDLMSTDSSSSSSSDSQ